MYFRYHVVRLYETADTITSTNQPTNAIQFHIKHFKAI